MAVLKIVLNHWGMAVVADRDSGSTGFPDINWDTAARAALDLSDIQGEIDDAIRAGFSMPAAQFARGRVVFDG